MKKSAGAKVQKKVKKVSRKAVTLVKKAKTVVKKETAKAKSKTRRTLGTANNKWKVLKKKSSKALHNATNMVYSTEEDIVAYVKENPVKSVSAAVLTALIAGYVARYKK